MYSKVYDGVTDFEIRDSSKTQDLNISRSKRYLFSK